MTTNKKYSASIITGLFGVSIRRLRLLFYTLPPDASTVSYADCRNLTITIHETEKESHDVFVLSAFDR